MEIEKAAVAGTLESSDCMVTVEDGDGNIDLVLESTVIHQSGYPGKSGSSEREN